MSKTYRGYTLEQVAKTIDHSILKPDFTDGDVRAGAELALKYNTASYCIRPMDVAVAADAMAVVVGAVAPSWILARSHVTIL